MSASDGAPLAPDRLAEEIAELAADKKAIDILVLDLRGVVGYADFFVICSGGTERQTKAIHDGVHLGLKERHGLLPRRVEGLSEARCQSDDTHYIEAVDAQLGDGNDNLVLSGGVGAAPGYFITAGGGNDTIDVAYGHGAIGHTFMPFVDGGPGNDKITVGAADQAQPADYFMTVDGGDGNDTIDTANGYTDIIDCGAGHDSLLDDPFDQEPYPPTDPQCESATPVQPGT